MSATSDKVVYLMRGLPSSGKSHTAREIAGPSGVVLETDAYFYSQVGDDPAQYDYRAELLPEARCWNLQRFEQALAAGVSPIVVDRGNGLNVESRAYALLGVQSGYRVELREPDSQWWQEIRVLLKYKRENQAILEQWANRLAEMSRETHRVPAATIVRWMQAWRHDLTVEEILACPDPADTAKAIVSS